jgi:crotonobetainyl-CoA:carnitine CoA-transferase CaiB-like acyl-CoA transferase
VYQRHSTGWGQHIDLSVMEAVAQTTDWSFANASVVRAAGGQPVELRAGSGPIYTIYPCKDGFVRLIILSPRQWHAMRAWLGEPEELQDPHWDGFIARLGIAADILNPMFAKLFANLNMVEVSVEAQRRGIVCTPVLKPEEVTTNEHLVSRGTFVDAEVAADVRGPVASGFFQFEGERQGYRAPAPALGEHSEAVFADSGPPRPTPGGAAPTPALPLEGIRVLDFGIGGVGVEAARLLGEYGADVIKVETRTYPDFIRVITGSEMSASFASSSRSKRGFGVNVKTEAGLAVLQRLVEHADVIIENASTGTMDDMGVGYTTIQKLNPRCIMVSSQLLGSRGVWADWIGYGPSTQPLGGMVHLWNYDDQESPAGSTSIFPDHLAGRLCAAAAVAGLIRRERTGTGGHAEVAQIEAVTGLLGDLLLKAAIEPGSVGPRGNKSDRGAPWGPYPCAGTQQWCAVSVRDDGDWRALQQAMGAPEWAADERLATTEGRLANRDALDARFSEWTLQQDKHDLTALLQARGIPAGPMLTGGEQIDDPHLVARGYPRALEQQDQGPMLFEGPSFRATGMADIQLFQAPRLGEHTRDICRELLGMADAEIDSLLSSGALEGPPESS